MKSLITILIAVLVFTVIITGVGLLTLQYALPQVIEMRARDLGLMQYDSHYEKLVPKDSMQLSREEFYYIMYGDTKNHK